jgi:predicted small lipoprotein YifL
MTRRTLSFAAIALLAIAGCGQTGALYLPGSDDDSARTVAAPADTAGGERTDMPAGDGAAGADAGVTDTGGSATPSGDEDEDASRRRREGDTEQER